MLSAVKPPSQVLTAKQLFLNPPKFTTEKLIAMGVYSLGSVIYINALDLLPSDERYSHGAVTLGLMMVNRKTDERLMIDLLTPSDRFATIVQIVRLHFPGNEWIFTGETWEIPSAEFAVSAA